MLLLAPNRLERHNIPVAKAIVAAVTNYDQQQQFCSVQRIHELVTLSFHETTFRTKNVHHFGLSCCIRYSAPLEHWAGKAITIIANGYRHCNYRTNMGKVFGHFHSGTCRITHWEEQETTTYNRLRTYRFIPKQIVAHNVWVKN